MEGDLSPYHGTFAPSAGIIPRTLYALFDKLAEDRAEFSVRVSFVELYNEELRDLNALDFSEPYTSGQPMDNRAGSSTANTTGPGSNGGGGLRIYDDKAAGTGVVIQGLEETLISCAEDGLKVLKRGSERRQIGATKCNEQSRCVAPAPLLSLLASLTPFSSSVAPTPSSPSSCTSRRRPSREERIFSRSASSTSSTSPAQRMSGGVAPRRVAPAKPA